MKIKDHMNWKSFYDEFQETKGNKTSGQEEISLNAVFDDTLEDVCTKIYSLIIPHLRELKDISKDISNLPSARKSIRAEFGLQIEEVFKVLLAQSKSHRNSKEIQEKMIAILVRINYFDCHSAELPEEHYDKTVELEEVQSPFISTEFINSIQKIAQTTKLNWGYQLNHEDYALNLIDYFSGTKNYIFDSNEISDLKCLFQLQSVRVESPIPPDITNLVQHSFFSAARDVRENKMFKTIVRKFEGTRLPIQAETLDATKKNIYLLCLEYAANPDITALESQKGLFLSHLLHLLIQQPSLDFSVCVDKAKANVTAFAGQLDPRLCNSRVAMIISNLEELQRQKVTHDNIQPGKGPR